MAQPQHKSAFPAFSANQNTVKKMSGRPGSEIVRDSAAACFLESIPVSKTTFSSYLRLKLPKTRSYHKRLQVVSVFRPKYQSRQGSQRSGTWLCCTVSQRPSFCQDSEHSLCLSPWRGIHRYFGMVDSPRICRGTFCRTTVSGISD